MTLQQLKEEARKIGIYFIIFVLVVAVCLISTIPMMKEIKRCYDVQDEYKIIFGSKVKVIQLCK